MRQKAEHPTLNYSRKDYAMSRFTNSISSGAGRLWNSWSTHRVKVAEARAKTPPEEQPDALDFEAESLTFAERVKWVYGEVVGLLAPFILATILSLSNGYFFAGLRDPSLNFLTILAYVGGATLESIGLYSVYTLSYAVKRGHRRAVVFSLIAFLCMACISVVAQLAFLKSDLALSVPQGTIKNVPILSILVGAYGGRENDVFFMFRAAGYHVGEIIVALLLLQRKKSYKKILAEKRERQQMEIEAQQTQLFRTTEPQRSKKEVGRKRTEAQANRVRRYRKRHKKWPPWLSKDERYWYSHHLENV